MIKITALLYILFPFSVYTQALKFVIPETMVLEDTTRFESGLLWTYIDKNGTDNMQVQEFEDVTYYVYFKNSTNETYSTYFDKLDRMTHYAYRKDLTATGYELDSNQRIIEFSVTTEDTSTKNGFTESSFVIQYHPNGALKKKFYYLKDVQEITEYWPDGSVKIVADYLAADFYDYCGKYREYDEAGRLVAKGQYNFPKDRMTKPVKTGNWKYYENGKLKSKEFIIVR